MPEFNIEGLIELVRLGDVQVEGEDDYWIHMRSQDRSIRLKIEKPDITNCWNPRIFDQNRQGARIHVGWPGFWTMRRLIKALGSGAGAGGLNELIARRLDQAIASRLRGLDLERQRLDELSRTSRNEGVACVSTSDR